MSPELNNLLLALIEVLISLIKTLENLRDISHVENVMTLGGGWEEILLDNVEQVNCCKSERLTKVLDLFVKDLEFESCNSLEDLLHLSLCWDGVVHNVEL